MAFNLIPPVFAEDVVGKLTPPSSVVHQLSDIGPKFFTPIVYLIILFAGIWAFLQFILGGVGYITASGDPKKISEAQSKLVHSLTGLAIIAVSFILAALVGQIFFGSATFILNPRIQTPAGGGNVGTGDDGGGSLW